MQTRMNRESPKTRKCEHAGRVNRSGLLNNPPKPADAQRSGASAGYPPGYSEPSIIFFALSGFRD